MALQPTQSLVNAGTAPTFNTVANSDTVLYGNGVNSFLVVRNTASTAVALTITPAGFTLYGKALPAYTASTPALANGEVWVPLRRDFDNGAANGTATLTFDVPANVKVAVVQVP